MLNISADYSFIKLVKTKVIVNSKFDQLIQEVKRESKFFLTIGFGVFLFILFFQPFPLGIEDFNNRLLIVAGLGAIVYFFSVLVRIVIPWIFTSGDTKRKERLFPSYFNGFMIFILSSLAFIFYIRYVGSVPVTFYMVFKVLIICLVPPVITGIHDSYTEVIFHNKTLMADIKQIQKKIEKYEEDVLNKTIDFMSDNISENFSLLIGEVAFIRSADNYVEIVYNENGVFKKRLIRNTLKSIELQIRQYTNFVRCHRICIVNVHFIEKLNRDSNSYWITIKGYEEKLPVSRQYLLKIKEVV